MKQVFRVILLVAILAVIFSNTQISYAQASDSIGFSARVVEQNQQTQVEVIVSASSSTLIQGISFLLKYDPACLRPSGMRSLVLNLNNTSMPQTDAAVEGIFTSTEPLPVNGNLVMVTFIPTAACQSQISLEKAQLIILNEEGLAQPLNGVMVDQTPAQLSVSEAQISSAPEPTQNFSVIGDATPQPGSGQPEETTIVQTEVVPLSDEENPAPNPLERLVVIGAGILILFAGILTVLIVALLRKERQAKPRPAIKPSTVPARIAPVPEHYLVIRRGIQAGTRVRVENFPFSLGNSPANDLPLEDPSISGFHAKLFLRENKVILVDLGHPIGTSLNGNTIHNQSVALKDGDVVKIGAILLMYTQVKVKAEETESVA